MKLSIFPRFGAQNSKPVFAAFAEGAKKIGLEVVEHDMSADVYVIWSVLWHGKMIANKAVWDAAKQNNKIIVVLEVGALHRGTTWRIGKHHINNLGYFGKSWNYIPNRSSMLGVELKPWTTSGQTILICGQHTKSEQWSNMPHPMEWLKTTVQEVKRHTDRPIIFRPHPRDWQWAQNIQIAGIKVKLPKQVAGTYDDFDFEDDLANAWAVINHSSNTGILSIINGVPAFVSHESLAVAVGNDMLCHIETPAKPSRDEWLDRICHTEWTLEEISSGLPIRRIFNI